MNATELLRRATWAREKRERLDAEASRLRRAGASRPAARPALDACAPHAFEWSPLNLEFVCGKCGATKEGRR